MYIMKGHVHRKVIKPSPWGKYKCPEEDKEDAKDEYVFLAKRIHIWTETTSKSTFQG